MSLRHTLLGLLDWGDLHGYALRDLTQGMSWLYPMSNSNLYPTLRSLEDEGFVVHRDQVRRGRLRKIYSVTEAGRAELRRWLGDATPLRMSYQDPVLLKLCLLREGALEGATPWVARELDAIRRRVDQGERFLKDADRLPRYARKVAELGVAQARVRAEWLADVLAQLEAETGGEEPH